MPARVKHLLHTMVTWMAIFLGELFFYNLFFLLLSLLPFLLSLLLLLLLLVLPSFALFSCLCVALVFLSVSASVSK